MQHRRRGLEVLESRLAMSANAVSGVLEVASLAEVQQHLQVIASPPAIATPAIEKAALVASADDWLGLRSVRDFEHFVQEPTSRQSRFREIGFATNWANRAPIDVATASSDVWITDVGAGYLESNVHPFRITRLDSYPELSVMYDNSVHGELDSAAPLVAALSALADANPLQRASDTDQLEGGANSRVPAKTPVEIANYATLGFVQSLGVAMSLNAETASVETATPSAGPLANIVATDQSGSVVAAVAMSDDDDVLYASNSSDRDPAQPNDWEGGFVALGNIGRQTQDAVVTAAAEESGSRFKNLADAVRESNASSMRRIDSISEGKVAVAERVPTETSEGGMVLLRISGADRSAKLSIIDEAFADLGSRSPTSVRLEATVGVYHAFDVSGNSRVAIRAAERDNADTQMNSEKLNQETETSSSDLTVNITTAFVLLTGTATVRELWNRRDASWNASK